MTAFNEPEPTVVAEPIAVNIYERMEMGGSVETDLNAMVADGASWADFEDYFGDTDPTDWL